jgi:hypothetical protein
VVQPCVHPSFVVRHGVARDGFLTADQAGRLFEVLWGEEVGIRVLVGLYSGLRATQYLALWWRNVDLTP